MRSHSVRAVLAVDLALGASLVADAQPTGKTPRVGVIHYAGHHHVVVDGLRVGLRELGLEERKHVVLDIREVTSDQAAEGAARDLERGNADLIYTVTSQVTLAAKRATTRTPIVFYVGADPVALGLVASLAKPGGRLTGVHGLARDVTAKRLAVLQQIMPKLRRVVTIYNPGDPVSQENARLGHAAARQLGVQVVERHAASVAELDASVRALNAREVDAYFHTPGALQTSQAISIIEAVRAKKLPSMFHEQSLVAKGALSAYGIHYQEIGRLSAKHVQRILAGSHPKDLPVENYDKVGFALNLRIAREIGLAIAPALRVQADQIIE